MTVDQKIETDYMCFFFICVGGHMSLLLTLIPVKYISRRQIAIFTCFLIQCHMIIMDMESWFIFPFCKFRKSYTDYRFIILS